MTIHELVTLLHPMEPEKDVFVAFFKTDGTGEIFDIEAVHDHNRHAQLDIDEEEEADDDAEGNGAVSAEDTGATPEAAEAATGAFLDFCERRGIAEEEKNLIRNAMAFLCYEQVESRQGPFYEAIKPFFAEGDA
jgi:hypothetical protein